MFADPIDIPDSLVSAQQAGRLVVFAGAGVSMGTPSNLPDFRALVRSIAAGTKIDVDNSPFDVTLGRLRDDGLDVHRECRDRILLPGSLPCEIHRLILRLFRRPEEVRVVTTNFDPHFTGAARELNLTLKHYFAPALPLGHNFRGIVHLHGEATTEPQNMVLTDDDFGRAYLSEGWARTFLQSLFTSYTVLFIGYRHGDLPVTYLARGMSARSTQPRFALTVESDVTNWKPLGVTAVAYPRHPPPNAHDALEQGVKRWVEIAAMQPLEREAAMRAILTAPEGQDPDRSQTDFLRHCLKHEEGARYFAKHAVHWRWIEWLHDQALLRGLLDAAAPEAERDAARLTLANWACRKLVHDETGRGLWLLMENGGRFGNGAWWPAAHELWTSDEIDFSKPGPRRWLSVISDVTRHDTRVDLLAYLLGKVATAGQWEPALFLFTVLAAPRTTLDEEWNFREVSPRKKAAPRLKLRGDAHELTRCWTDHFVPELHKLAQPLFAMLECGLVDAHRLCVVNDLANARSNPVLDTRARIDERTGRGDRDDAEVLLDFFADVISAMLTRPDAALLRGKAEAWLSGANPILVRFGLHTLGSLSGMSSGDKITAVFQSNLLYPEVLGAAHEVYYLLKAAYPGLNEDQKRQLWTQIESGPPANWLHDVEIEREKLQSHRQNEIDKIVWFLAHDQTGDGPAADAFARLRARAPEFAAAQHKHIDVHFWMGGDEDPEWQDRSPKTVNELLAKPPAEQIEFLLTFKGAQRIGGETAEQLAATAASAARTNPDWGEQLWHALAERKAFDHVVSRRMFWHLEWKELKPGLKIWLVNELLAQVDGIEEFGGIVRLIFDHDPADTAEANSDLASRMLELSCRIWRALAPRPSESKESAAKTDWTSRAINHPAGRIVEFWLRYTDKIRPDPKLSPGEWPKPLAPFFDEIYEQKSYAANLGLAILAQHLGFVRFIAPEWTRTHVFARMSFAHHGDGAYCLWQPFLDYGRLNRDLILELPRVFHAEFGHFAHEEKELGQRFCAFVAIIVHSQLWDARSTGWLDDFLRAMPVEFRARWAESIGRYLHEASTDDRLRAWSTWIKPYWQDRLRGRPLPLESAEAAEMVEWVFALLDVTGEVFPLASELHFTDPDHGAIFWQMAEKTKLAEEQPQRAVQFLDWLLPHFTVLHETQQQIAEMIDRMPPQVGMRDGLLRVCNELNRLGYASAGELAERVKAKFPPAG